MLKLEVVFGDEAEMVWTDIFESADPSTFFCKATDDLACWYLQVALLQWEEVTYDFVDTEVLHLLELFEVSLGDLDVLREWLRKGESIATLIEIGVRSDWVV